MEAVEVAIDAVVHAYVGRTRIADKTDKNCSCLIPLPFNLK